MELLESLLGIQRRRRSGDDVGTAIKGLSRWVFGCGCALVLAIVGGIGLLAMGVINFGDQALVAVVVIAMIVVAVVSLVRNSISERFHDSDYPE